MPGCFKGDDAGLAADLDHRVPGIHRDQVEVDRGALVEHIMIRRLGVDQFDDWIYFTAPLRLRFRSATRHAAQKLGLTHG